MNAIILAAGLGSRFNELTTNNHKALLPINGIPNIEHTIRHIKKFGINEINVVTGHMSHLFNYLKDKYQCNLIYNQHYADYNSIYSFNLASEFFNNSIVIDADVVLLKNIFVTLEKSAYYVIERPENLDKEWIPILNNYGIIESMQVSNANAPSLLGISYWNASACELIRKELPKYLNDETLKNSKLYWDNIPISLFGEIEVTTHLVDKTHAAEMDTVENYNYICNNLLKIC
ncbi:lic-1 operon protein [Xenorhabdus mauleonii]|uniref:CTP:phosphocholine cytidylyltransferase n=1 Tax=Xenorhabdus mauleonii TaxID=351675 RepID=A0A1I3TXT6_9GAMM|nr:NTP transferase domain-containing protein [Xenorhabdus mauleonii]PHM39572.1 lic-1 operon protein [Xenorhabdus mauleonii]SFJ75099.1 CTP:phosphocholine cytidylyltransferase [Xenorhabdus mauleonii]